MTWSLSLCPHTCLIQSLFCCFASYLCQCKVILNFSRVLLVSEKLWIYKVVIRNSNGIYFKKLHHSTTHTTSTLPDGWVSSPAGKVGQWIPALFPEGLHYEVPLPWTVSSGDETGRDEFFCPHVQGCSLTERLDISMLYKICFYPCCIRFAFTSLLSLMYRIYV